MAHEDEGVGFDMVGGITTEREEAKQSADIAAFEADLRKKKKKKKKKKNKNKKAKQAESSAADSAGKDSYFSPDDVRDYPYTVMLDRIFGTLQANNTQLLERQSHHLPPPLVALHGSKKTGWGNFKEICEQLNRSQDHVKLFFLTEMNTTGNLDGSNNFIIKGRWRPKQVESLLKKYIREYVTCNNCRSPKTVMRKDMATRLYFIDCQQCKATRSVETVRAGFRAVQRGERRAARNAGQK